MKSKIKVERLKELKSFLNNLPLEAWDDKNYFDNHLELKLELEKKIAAVNCDGNDNYREVN